MDSGTACTIQVAWWGWPVFCGHVTHDSPSMAAPELCKLRTAHMRALFVADNDDIPSDKSYTHRHSCRELHPGLCCTDGCYKDALLLAKSMERCLAEDSIGRFLKVVITDQDIA